MLCDLIWPVGESEVEYLREGVGRLNFACFRLWQTKAVSRWSVRNGAGPAWRRDWATLQAKTSALCCARTTRGLSTPLRCSSLVLACRYQATHFHLSFINIFSPQQRYLLVKTYRGLVWCCHNVVVVFCSYSSALQAEALRWRGRR